MKIIACIISCTLLLLTSCTLANIKETKNMSVNLIPFPNKIEYGTGYFSLSKSSVILYSNSKAKQDAINLQQSLATITKYNLKVIEISNAKTRKNSILITLTDTPEASEAYKLTINNDQIELKATTATGLFYATQTLIQLLTLDNNHQWQLPQVSIHDAPRFQYRGMHLDVSRTFYNVAFIKKYIDLIAMYKMNVFHWHLTDDQGWRIEIKKYPKLTEIGAWREATTIGHTFNREPQVDNIKHGGFYTQTEIKDIVKYAQARHITIIPEIDVPGHASAILAAYPQLSCDKKSYKVQSSFGIFKEVLCPTPESMQFIEDVLTEITKLFPSQYIHIGGDEVKTSQWQDCDYCKLLAKQQGLKDTTQLQTYFTQQILLIANKLNKKIIGWDEVLSFTKNTNVAIMSWRNVQPAVDAATAGHKVIMTPLTAYFDFYQSRSLDEPQAIHGINTLEEIYAYNWIPTDIKPDQRENILGIQANVWTEYIRTEKQVEYMLLPRMLAIAEAAWTTRANRDWQSFSTRVKADAAKLQKLGYNSSQSAFKVAADSKLNQDNNLEVNLTTQFDDLQIFYTVDGSNPGKNSISYKKPLVLTSSTLLKAVSYDSAIAKYYGNTQVNFSKHLALNKPLHIQGREQQPKNDSVLTNGQLLRTQIFHYDEWFAFNDKELSLTIDLQQPTQVSSITIGFQVKLHRRLYLPTAINISVSDDNKTWQQLANLKQPKTEQLAIKFKIHPQKMQFIKVNIENQQSYYSFEDSKQKPVTLYIDEIEIN